MPQDDAKNGFLVKVSSLLRIIRLAEQPRLFPRDWWRSGPVYEQVQTPCILFARMSVPFFSVNIRTEESGMCKCCFNIYLKRVQISGIVRVIWPGNSHRQRYREKLERARLILITVLGEKQKEHVFNRYTVYEASEHTSQALSIWHNDSLRAMF